MESEDDSLEMEPLQEQSPSEYGPLLEALQRRHLPLFKSRVRRALSRPGFDVNHLLPHPALMTLLDKAASDDLADFVHFLLEVGADPNLVNAERGRAPLHFATERGSSEALAQLLRAKNVRPNLQVNQMTALHYAVKANDEVCARLLLLANASPNVPNSKGVTPLHYAAAFAMRGMVELILRESRVPVDLETYKDRKGETTKELIKKKFQNLEIPESAQSEDYSSILRYHLTANDEERFVGTLAGIADSLDAVTNKSELMKLAVKNDLQRATAAMMDLSEFDDDIARQLPELCRLAVEQANPEILKELLAKGAQHANRLLLTACQELAVPVSPGPKNRDNRLECVRIILEQSDVDVRQEDDKGNSPLHYAARAECRQAVELLLAKGSYIGHANDFGVPPLAHIAPGVLESHLDECLQSENERTEEYEIVVNYENLEPHCARGKGAERSLMRGGRSSSGGAICSETEALLYIADSQSLRHLLKHPVLASFLYLKYLRIRHALYANFLFYLAYYACLITYVWFITSDEQEVEQEESMLRLNKTRQAAEDGLMEDEEEDTGMFDNWQKRPILSTLVAVTSLYLVVRELMQMLSSPLHYFGSLENWLELLLIGLTAGLLLGCGRQVAAIVILVSTWELIILMSQYPRLSTNIEMFKTVAVNFLKFLFLYMFMILAFAFSFFVLFKSSQEDNSFFNPVGSLFKTIIMLTGEFDSGDLPFGAFPAVSKLVFIGFIFLIVIILLNLLNGLAVNDTGEILSQAELVCLVSRARLIAYVERVAVGSRPVAKSNFCCFLNQLPTCGLSSGLRFLARRIQLFPGYLPHAQLSVKCLKNYEIKLHGRPFTGSRCSTLKMDPVIAQRAKQILAERDRETSEDKILSKFDSKFDKLDEKLNELSRMILEMRNQATRKND